MLKLVGTSLGAFPVSYNMSEIDPDILYKAQNRLLSQSITNEDRELLRSLLLLAKQQAGELDALKRISLNLTSTLDLKTVLNIVTAEAIKLLPRVRVVRTFLYKAGQLTFGSVMDADGNTDLPYHEPRPDGLTMTVAKTSGTIVVEDMSSHPLFKGVTLDWPGSIIGIPLKMGTRVMGVMNLSRETIGGFSREELRLLQILADYAALAIVNADLHGAVSRQAYTDILTGLPNRRALDERLDAEVQRARRFNHTFAVVMMDLDGFKSINDTYGHDVGDRVLQRTFSAVARNLRSTDFLARYGGDELTLIMPESTFDAALVVAQKLQGSLRRLVITMPDGTNRTFDLSGGIALYPTHGLAASDLLRAADAALYRAKRQARGTFMPARLNTGGLVMPSG